jgi:hypothetical protein
VWLGRGFGVTYFFGCVSQNLQEASPTLCSSNQQRLPCEKKEPNLNEMVEKVSEI